MEFLLEKAEYPTQLHTQHRIPWDNGFMLVDMSTLTQTKPPKSISLLIKLTAASSYLNTQDFKAFDLTVTQRT